MTVKSTIHLAGIDQLGRKLPEFGQVSVPREGKFVGLFYFLWAGQHGTSGPYDITKILEQDSQAPNDPNHPLWGPPNAFHHWGEALFDYYFADDAWVLRKHVQMMTDADVDFIVFDTTNAAVYKNVYDVLFPILEEVRLQGRMVPQFVFYTNSHSGKTVTALYEDIYKQGRHQDLWFQWDGKPLMIGYPEECSAEVQSFFTFRLPQWPNEPQKSNSFPWIEFVRPQQVYPNSEGEIEFMNVSVAQHPAGVMSDTPFYDYPGNWGRSFHHGKDHSGSPDAVNWGHNIAEQWDYALAQDPQVIFITGWNEWMAMRLQGPDERPVRFVDQATHEFSRDIEPMKGGHGDSYYLQMIDYIRRFKGMGSQEAPSIKQTIVINDDFSQWNNIRPEYKDYTNDTVARYHGGYGGVTYTNHTGRNDFDTLKVARDDKHLYFYARTVDPITLHTDPKWMRLLIQTDANVHTGWEGYNYIVNRNVINATTTTVEKNTGGWSWQSVGTVSYRVNGNELHLAIPRSLLGLSDVSRPLKLHFKWSDNMQEDGNIMDFYVNGDSAPDGRLNYQFSEEAQL